MITSVQWDKLCCLLVWLCKSSYLLLLPCKPEWPGNRLAWADIRNTARTARRVAPRVVYTLLLSIQISTAKSQLPYWWPPIAMQAFAGWLVYLINEFEVSRRLESFENLESLMSRTWWLEEAWEWAWELEWSYRDILVWLWRDQTLPRSRVSTRQPRTTWISRDNYY